MDSKQLANVGIAYSEGVARFAGHAQIYEKLLRKFPADPTYAALMTAVEQGDVNEAFRMAHTMKGNTGNLSINGLYKSLQPLVEALRAGDLEGARPYLEEVKRQYAAVVQVIEAEG